LPVDIAPTHGKPHSSPGCDCDPCKEWLVEFAYRAVTRAENEGTPADQLEGRALAIMNEELLFKAPV
jgi:hypothetical protein